MKQNLVFSWRIFSKLPRLFAVRANHINWTSLVSSPLGENSGLALDVTKPDYVMKNSSQRRWKIWNSTSTNLPSVFWKNCLYKRFLLNQSWSSEKFAELFLSLKTMQISKTGNICKKSCKYYRKTSNCYFKLLNKRLSKNGHFDYYILQCLFFLDSCQCHSQVFRKHETVHGS